MEYQVHYSYAHSDVEFIEADSFEEAMKIWEDMFRGMDCYVDAIENEEGDVKEYDASGKEITEEK